MYDTSKCDHYALYAADRQPDIPNEYEWLNSTTSALFSCILPSGKLMEDIIQVVGKPFFSDITNQWVILVNKEEDYLVNCDYLKKLN